MSIAKSKLLKFYKENREILEEIVRLCDHREVAFMYADKVFSRRPLVIENEGDVIAFVRKGAISFHISEERWRDPLQLSTKMKKKDILTNRIGWDLILDIDGKELVFSKILAIEAIKLLKKFEVKSISIKYSGNKGFHIGVPWEAIPDRVLDIHVKNEFPELPRVISAYIMEKTKKRVMQEILKRYDEEELKKKYGIIDLDVQKLVNIDTILISERHLFRMPFSINEKTGYLSVPISEKDIKYFYPEDASLDNYEYDGLKFLDWERSSKNELEKLILTVLAWKETLELKKIEEAAAVFEESKIKEEVMQEITRFQKSIKRKKVKISEEYFPPCIKNILKGIEDGRKRAVFILINFLSHMGWSWDEIKNKLFEWNEKNPEPLKERYIEYQLEWHMKKHKEGRKYLPPNCNNPMYYKDMGVCKKDDLCLLIKNPLQYPYRKLLKEKASKDRSNQG